MKLPLHTMKRSKPLEKAGKDDSQTKCTALLESSDLSRFDDFILESFPISYISPVLFDTVSQDWILN